MYECNYIFSCILQTCVTGYATGSRRRFGWCCTINQQRPIFQVTSLHDTDFVQVVIQLEKVSSQELDTTSDLRLLHHVLPLRSCKLTCIAGGRFELRVFLFLDKFLLQSRQIPVNFTRYPELIQFSYYIIELKLNCKKFLNTRKEKQKCLMVL